MKTYYDVLNEVKSKFEGEFSFVDFNKNYGAYDVMGEERELKEILKVISKDATKVFELAKWELPGKNDKIIGKDLMNDIIYASKNDMDYIEHTNGVVTFIATKKFVYIWGDFYNTRFLLTTFLTMDEWADVVWETRFQLFED